MSLKNSLWKFEQMLVKNKKSDIGYTMVVLVNNILDYLLNSKRNVVLSHGILSLPTMNVIVVTKNRMIKDMVKSMINILLCQNHFADKPLKL